MEETNWTVENTDKNSIYFKYRFQHKIDPNKIKTIDDVIEILKRIPMYVDDVYVKAIEHLVVSDEEQNVNSWIAGEPLK